jgi:hypothetical protein
VNRGGGGMSRSEEGGVEQRRRGSERLLGTEVASQAGPHTTSM